MLFVSAIGVDAQSVSGSIKNDTLQKNILDNAQYRVFYSLEFVKDTFAPEKKTKCTTVLLIGSKYNSFLDYGALRRDSILDAMTKAGASFNEIFTSAFAIGKTAKFNPVVIKLYPDNKQFTIQNSIGSLKFNYEDKDVELNWKPEQEEKEIEGYKCLKATCNFRGRHYTAWYSPDISISEGPYVFGGLPGLIMEIYDSKQHYLFRIAGFKKVETYDPIYIIANNKVTVLSREQVRKIIANSYANPAAVITNNMEIKDLSDEVMAKLKPKPYNPVELH